MRGFFMLPTEEGCWFLECASHARAFESAGESQLIASIPMRSGLRLRKHHSALRGKLREVAA